MIQKNIKLFYLFIIIVLVGGCSRLQENKIPLGSRLFLYSQDYGNKNVLMLYNYDLKKSYELSEFGNPFLKIIKFYNDGKKLVVMPNPAYPNHLYIYDINTSNKDYFKVLYPWREYFTQQQFDMNLSYMLFSNGENLYYGLLKNNSSLDSIQLNAKGVGYFHTNKNNITAIIYNIDSEKFDLLSFMNPYSKFEIVDLNTKTRKSLPYKPIWISNWSPDGKRIIFKDSTSTKVMEYTSLQIKELKGIRADSLWSGKCYFLDNQTIVFGGANPENRVWQIYTYDLVSDKVKECLTSKYESTLLDVYSKP